MCSMCLAFLAALVQPAAGAGIGTDKVSGGSPYVPRTGELNPAAVLCLCSDEAAARVQAQQSDQGLRDTPCWFVFGCRRL